MMRAASDVLYQRVTELWQAGGRTPGTIDVYLQWVRRFHARFGTAGDGAMLTAARVDAFAAEYVGPRGCAPDNEQRHQDCGVALVF